MIDLGPQAYVSKVWFVHWPGGDWLAILYKDNAAEPVWTLCYRFRYYAEPDGKEDPFDERDRKSWYRAKGVKAETEARAGIELIAGMTVLEKGGELDSFEVNGDADRFTTLLARRPWAHVQIRREQRGIQN